MTGWVRGTLNNLAWSLGKRGHARLARFIAHLYQRMYPSDQRGIRVLAQAFEDSGDPEAAETSIRRGLTKWSDSIELKLALSRLLASRLRFDEMAVMVDEMLSKHPDAPQTYQAMATLALFQGDPDAAARCVDESLRRRSPDDGPDDLISLGMVLLHIPNQRQKGESLLREAALMLRQGDPYVHMILALLDWDLRPKTADAHFKQARMMWPGSMKKFDREIEMMRRELEAGGVLAPRQRSSVEDDERSAAEGDH